LRTRQCSNPPRELSHVQLTHGWRRVSAADAFLAKRRVFGWQNCGYTARYNESAFLDWKLKQGVSMEFRSVVEKMSIDKWALQKFVILAF
jgi:hypothetical protein